MGYGIVMVFMPVNTIKIIVVMIIIQPMRMIMINRFVGMLKYHRIISWPYLSS